MLTKPQAPQGRSKNNLSISASEAEGHREARPGKSASNLSIDTKEPEPWAPFEPTAERPWDRRLAAHLLRRAGFGPNQSEIEQTLDDGPRKTIDRLIRPPEDLAAFDQMYADNEAASEGSIDSLRAWWLRRMIYSPYPLIEKLTLFWHGHFATSQAEVGRSPLMQRHVKLLRRYALGDFPSLLKAVMLDPATLYGLEAQENRRIRPPLTLARALLAHFTVSEGNFTEQDVTETARAFTGWFVLRTERRFTEREFDPGKKCILGRQGISTAEEAIQAIADDEATARTIVRKLYRQFISEVDEPSDVLLDPLVESFAANGEILQVVETMLRSNLLFSPAAYRCRVKSPVEFGVGLVRAFDGRVGSDRLGQRLANLGQNLYHPPTAAGWPDGLAWLGDATIVGRNNLAYDLLKSGREKKFKLDPRGTAKRLGQADAARFFTELLLQNENTEAGAAASAYAVACRPEYQLA